MFRRLFLFILILITLTLYIPVYADEGDVKTENYFKVDPTGKYVLIPSEYTPATGWSYLRWRTVGFQVKFYDKDGKLQKEKFIEYTSFNSIGKVLAMAISSKNAGIVLSVEGAKGDITGSLGGAFGDTYVQDIIDHKGGKFKFDPYFTIRTGQDKDPKTKEFTSFKDFYISGRYKFTIEQMENEEYAKLLPAWANGYDGNGNYDPKNEIRFDKETYTKEMPTRRGVLEFGPQDPTSSSTDRATKIINTGVTSGQKAQPGTTYTATVEYKSKDENILTHGMFQAGEYISLNGGITLIDKTLDELKIVHTVDTDDYVCRTYKVNWTCPEQSQVELESNISPTDSNPLNNVDKVTVPINYQPPTPPSAAGTGEISFSPDQSGWVNHDIEVTVAVTPGPKQVTQTHSPNWGYTAYGSHNSSCYEDRLTCTITDPSHTHGLGCYTSQLVCTSDHADHAYSPRTFSQVWTATNIHVLDNNNPEHKIDKVVTDGISKQITISNEGENIILSASLNDSNGWVKGTSTWDDLNGKDWDTGSPGDTLKPTAKYLSYSGTYKIDKTKPVIKVVPENQSTWSNKDISVTINASDELSGLKGIKSFYEVIDKSHYKRNTIKVNFSDKVKADTKTVDIQKDGVYEIKVTLEDLAANRQIETFDQYRLDSTGPDNAQFLWDYVNQVKSVYKNGRTQYEYICNPNNTIDVELGDNLSGVEEAKYMWSDNATPINYADMASPPNELKDKIKVIKDPANPGQKFTTGEDTDQSIVVTINLHDSTEYWALRKGTKYLHIYQRDRAGNVTYTVSPPIFINKIGNFRVSTIYDVDWKNYFRKADNSFTSLATDGITAKNMPIFRNKEGLGVKMGYSLDMFIDSTGFNNANDKIIITASYYGLDKSGVLRPVSVYAQNKSGQYVNIASNASEYYAKAKEITLNGNYRKVDTSQAENNIWGFNYFLPYNARIVRQGQSAPLNYNPEFSRLLVVFGVVAERNYGTQIKKLDYTWLENSWSTNNGSVYGQNYPSGNDLAYNTDPVNKSLINHGEVFWYDLTTTVMDDIRKGRKW